MAIIKWTDDLSVKINSIDAQHKRLVELVNSLHDSMTKGAAKEVLGKILDELVSYTKSHFANEEKYFDQHKYPDAAKHKQEHQTLTTKAIALQSEFKAGKVTLSIQTLNFLKDWLANHIMVSDKAYSAFLVGKGVS